MENLIKFPLAGGDHVVVQLDSTGTNQPNARSPGTIREVAIGFEAAAAKLRPIAQVLLAQIKDLGPDELKLEFAVGFSAEAGVILAKSGAEGHCKIGMVWRRQ